MFALKQPFLFSRSKAEHSLLPFAGCFRVEFLEVFFLSLLRQSWNIVITSHTVENKTNTVFIALYSKKCTREVAQCSVMVLLGSVLFFISFTSHKNKAAVALG